MITENEFVYTELRKKIGRLRTKDELLAMKQDLSQLRKNLNAEMKDKEVLTVVRMNRIKPILQKSLILLEIIDYEIKLNKLKEERVEQESFMAKFKLAIKAELGEEKYVHIIQKI